MAEAVRNALIAMVAIGLIHNVVFARRSRIDDLASGRVRIMAAAPGVDAIATQAPGGIGRAVHAQTNAQTAAQTNMPMDGLREMFEFATARQALASACDKGPPGDGPVMPPMQRTDTVFPEQIGGSNAVVNTYEHELAQNGGAGDVAPFDGWGGAAALT